MDRLDGIREPLDAGKALAADQRCRVKAETSQMRLRRLDSLKQRLNLFHDGRDDLFTARAIITKGILGKRRAQARQHAVVIHDQAEILTGIDAISPSDRLHQRVGLHRLVDVKRRETLHVKAGQPHRANNSDTERVLWGLESGFDIYALAVSRIEALLHQGAMRDDVEAPFLEVGDLILRFADDDLDDRLIKPRGLCFQLPGLVQECGAGGVIALRHGLQPLRLDGRSHLGRFRLPARHDPLVQPGAGDLVDAHEHRLA